MSNLLKLLHRSGEGVYAVDLDGATEYMKNTNPVGLDLNDVNRILTLGRNSTFEDNITDWLSGGNHIMSIDSAAPLTGSYSGKIIASGVGDDSTNFVSLDSSKFTPLVSGKNYTLQLEVLATLANTDVTIVIGDKSKTFTAISNVAKQTLVYNFAATTSTTGDLQLFLNQADSIWIDEIDISESYNMTISVWFNTTYNAAEQDLIYYGSSVPYWYLKYRTSTRLRFDIVDNSSTYAMQVTTDLTDGVWRLLTYTIDRLGNLTLYTDGVLTGTPILITSLGVIRSSTNPLFISAHPVLTQKVKGLMGGIKIDRGTNADLTPAQILTNYNRGLAGKNMVKTGNEKLWIKWKGGTNALMLKDISNTGNDLTGINVTISDQVKLKNYQ